ncbi:MULTISPECIES: thioesterase domain-containing protein [Streptomycetaceae]|uniref:thioesterase II family protein n=1 Tax=unclassified Streptomyces TaxID=2593676 RepID=UPI00338BCB9D
MTYLRSFTPADRSAFATVVVFPQAGAGCLRLRSTASALPSGLNLLGVQMPGREDRLNDSPANSLSEVVARIGAELRDPALHRPLVLLGVSLGALIAYEVARKLEPEGAGPRSLVVAAARSPEYWRSFPAADPPSAELTALLHPSVRDSGTARYALATLRSDVRLMAGYQVPSTPLTSTSLRSVSGSRDDVATTAQMSGWRDRSTHYQGHQVISADHHAFMDQDVLIGILSDVAETARRQVVHG